MASYEMFIRSVGLGKILWKCCSNRMVLLSVFDTFFKCSSKVNLLSNVNPKCFVMMPEKHCYWWMTNFL